MRVMRTNLAKDSLHGRSKGFTLIELMVVVGIIGVLASVVATRFGTELRKRWALKRSTSELANSLVMTFARARKTGQVTTISFANSCAPDVVHPEPKAYSYTASQGTVCAELADDIYFVDVGGDGPQASGGGVHAMQPGFPPAGLFQFNSQGFSASILNSDNDTIYIARVEPSTGDVDPMFVRAIVVRNIGQPQVWERSLDLKWHLVTGN